MNDRPPLTEDEMNAIAERAAKRAIEMVYTDIGKSVIKKILWLIGVVALGMLIFLSGKEVIKL